MPFSEQPEISPYHVFSTLKEAEMWIDEKAAGWTPLLTPDELQAVRIYKGSKGDEFQKINQYLRGRWTLTDEDEDRVLRLVPRLDAALRKGVVDRPDGVVPRSASLCWRGLSGWRDSGGPGLLQPDG